MRIENEPVPRTHTHTHIHPSPLSSSAVSVNGEQRPDGAPVAAAWAAGRCLPLPPTLLGSPSVAFLLGKGTAGDNVLPALVEHHEGQREGETGYHLAFIMLYYLNRTIACD